MSKENESQKNSRREFLKSASLATGAVGVIAVAVSSTSAQAKVSKGEVSQSGYQETEHVKKYYELARF
jgi:nitrous oxide reductase